MTWDYLPIGYWSAVETHVGVMVACLPAIRSLQRSLRERWFPKPATNTSYYGDHTKDSSKKSSSRVASSRKWSSKSGISRLNTLGRSEVDKDDFVRLNEYEMRAGVGTEKFTNEDKVTAQCSSETPLSRSFRSNEDDLPLAATAAPMGRPLGGIMVRTEYSVDGFRQSTSERERGRVRVR